MVCFWPEQLLNGKSYKNIAHIFEILNDTAFQRGMYLFCDRIQPKVIGDYKFFKSSKPRGKDASPMYKWPHNFWLDKVTKKLQTSFESSVFEDFKNVPDFAVA